MSRRVFDVGLDMGRIKNGLKLNKENRRTKTTRSTSSSYADGSPYQNQQVAILPKLEKERSAPNVHNLEYEDRDSEPIILPAPTSPEVDLHGGFPQPPSHHSSPVNDGSSLQGLSPEQRYSSGDNSQNFDLRPPPPNKPVKFLDTLAELLFSGDHLNVILRDPSFFLRFTAFLNRYRPQSAPGLVRYLEAQKAIKAIEYANLLAQALKSLPGDPPDAPCPAASIDPKFAARSKKAFDTLVTEALPAYITHAMVKVVTESMVREITGTTMPLMRELVGGLAEIFCLSDPSVKDNPIVYASEDFYRTTQYGRDYAIGRNCRFLQGPNTDRTCVARIRAAIKAGHETSELLLNYRRDGSPFMNLLMIAPLYDNRGTVRYYLGAQVDVSGLIEDGRGLDSLARCLEEKSQRRQREIDMAQESGPKKTLRTLNEFGQMLSLDESAVFQSHSRSGSMPDNASSTNYSSRGVSQKREVRQRLARRVLGTEERDEEDERSPRGIPSMGHSGKLPGVYQNYLLIRPYPSLRIIFVSPALRIPGLLQSPFLSRIGGPAHVRDGLSDAFEAGAAVTAKVLWLPQGRAYESDNPTSATNGETDPSRPKSRRGPTHHHNVNGMNGDAGSRARYVSCTPLFGSDDQVGVWMIVMVENEQVTGSLASRDLALKRYGEIQPMSSEYEREDYSSPTSAPKVNGHAGQGHLYADFLREQGKPTNGKERSDDGAERERDGMVEDMLEGLGDAGVEQRL